MKTGTLRIATCQFAVSDNIRRNADRIKKFLRKAARAKADIVHFPECALSGYVGRDFSSFEGFDWRLLREKLLEIGELAGKLKLWVVVGSAHRLTGVNKPYNSLYLIGPAGKVVDRYDKRFCIKEELEHFTPGERWVTFDVKGVKCALLICFELRFPEIYRQLYKMKVNCVLQSFYNARQKRPSAHRYIMRQTMQANAADNYFWASCSNASGWYSPYPSFFVRPDGRIVRQLVSNRAGMIVNTVDLRQKFYDPMAGFREMVMRGKLSSGRGKLKTLKV